MAGGSPIGLRTIGAVAGEVDSKRIGSIGLDAGILLCTNGIGTAEADDVAAEFLEVSGGVGGACAVAGEGGRRRGRYRSGTGDRRRRRMRTKQAPHGQSAEEYADRHRPFHYRIVHRFGSMDLDKSIHP